MNIVFWNCQGLRPKWKELQNYLLENQIDILALNETFLKPKFKFHLPGYDIYNESFHRADSRVRLQWCLEIAVDECAKVAGNYSR